MSDSSNPTGLPELVLLGDPQLAQPSVAVPLETISSTGFQEKLRLLELGLRQHRANGIAAPQLGWFQRFLMMREPGRQRLRIWINPVLTTTTEELLWGWEGCLSVPGYKAYVGRASAIAVRGLDGQGKPLSREYSGWEAHLFQHEYDHLDGMLFPYRVAHPRHLVSQQAYDSMDGWPADWPLPGAKYALQRNKPAANEYFD